MARDVGRAMAGVLVAVVLLGGCGGAGSDGGADDGGADGTVAAEAPAASSGPAPDAEAAPTSKAPAPDAARTSKARAPDAPAVSSAEAFLREAVAGLASGCEPPLALNALEQAYGASVVALPPDYERFERRLAEPEGGSRLVAGLGPATLEVVEDERYSILAVPVLDAQVHGLRVRELRWISGVDNGISAVELRFDATPTDAASRLVEAGLRLQPGEFAEPSLGAARDGGGAALGCDFSM